MDKRSRVLLSGEDSWPTIDFRFSSDEDTERREITLTVQTTHFIDISQFPNYLPLKRMMGWCLRNCQKRIQDEEKG